MAHQKVIRVTRLLQMAEVHLIDLSRLVDSPEVESQVESLGILTRDFENRLSSLITGNKPRLLTNK